MIKMNNEMLVRDLMNFSPRGALGQVFIVEAIRFYSEQVMRAPAEDDEKAFINPLVWKEIAEDVHKRISSNFEETPAAPNS